MSLINELKAHDFKKSNILTYTALNDKNIKGPTDIGNDISKLFKKQDIKNKFQLKVLEAMFDKVYAISVNKTSKKFHLTNTKTMDGADLEIINKGGVIEFKADKASFKFEAIKIHTPEVVTKPTDTEILKKENKILLKHGVQIIDKNLNAANYKAIAEVFLNMSKTQT